MVDTSRNNVGSVYMELPTHSVLLNEVFCDTNSLGLIELKKKTAHVHRIWECHDSVVQGKVGHPVAGATIIPLNRNITKRAPGLLSTGALLCHGDVNPSCLVGALIIGGGGKSCQQLTAFTMAFCVDFLLLTVGVFWLRLQVYRACFLSWVLCLSWMGCVVLCCWGPAVVRAAAVLLLLGLAGSVPPPVAVVWGDRNTSEWGTKSVVAHKWANWRHNPCRPGGPQRWLMLVIGLPLLLSSVWCMHVDKEEWNNQTPPDEARVHK